MGIIGDKKRDKPASSSAASPASSASSSSGRPLSFWGGHKSRSEPVAKGLHPLPYGGSTGHLDGYGHYGHAAHNGLRPAVSMPVVSAPPPPPPPPLSKGGKQRHRNSAPPPVIGAQSVTRMVRSFHPSVTIHPSVWPSRIRAHSARIRRSGDDGVVLDRCFYVHFNALKFSS